MTKTKQLPHNLRQIQIFMSQIPNFPTKRTGTHIYKEKDSATHSGCNYCADYLKRRGCKHRSCQYLGERIKSGGIGYGELLKSTYFDITDKLFAAILPVVIFASVILILLAEFGSVTFTERSGSFEIKDMTFYSATFNDDDIESVELTEEINVNSKTNGNATSRLNVGYFNVEGIGNALLFIHKDVKTIVKVTLIGGEVIFLNGESEAMTADYYKMLTE